MYYPKENTNIFLVVFLFTYILGWPQVCLVFFFHKMPIVVLSCL